jgi:Glycosyl hydrolases family 43
VGRDRRHVWRGLLALTVTLVCVVVLLEAIRTDVGARARSRQEQSDLTHAKVHLARLRHDTALTSYSNAVTTNKRNILQATIATTLSQLAATNSSIKTAFTDAYLQGASIATLQACLGGVQNALNDLKFGNNAQAAKNISAVSGPCTALATGSTGGLVYPFDFPDPDVILVGQTYFAYATNSVAGNIQILQSTDLTHWSAVGDALPSLPQWAAPNYTWAPSVSQIGGKFVLYYAANLVGSGTECISVATATQPQGPFVDQTTAPLECQRALGGSIDPSSFIDSNGTPFLLWKSGGPGNSKIWSEQLNATGTAFAAGATATGLLVPVHPWEAGTVEAPALVEANGHFFLFFSGNDWNSASYAIGVAVCTSPVGPCLDDSSQPLLASGPGEQGPGGPSVFADTSGTWWMAFHAWTPGAVGFPHSRDLYLRKLDMTGQSPVVEPVSAG